MTDGEARRPPPPSARERPGAPAQGPVDAEAYTEDLFEHAPCGYLVTRPDGTFIRVNQTFLDWTGHLAEQLVGLRRFQDLLTAGGRIYHETHYAPLLRMQDKVREVALDVVCADGRRLPVLVNAVLCRDAQDRPHSIRTAVFDATDRRGYERELLRARTRAEESEARARLLAQTLQSSLIPPAPPAIPGLDVGAAYRPAGEGDEVGGDFYDVFELPDGDWAVLLGDVQGKGPQAATVTALARYTVRAAAIQTADPAAVLRLLNAALLQQQAERFCTLAYGVVCRRAGPAVTLRLALGGHAQPLRRGAGGETAYIGRPGDLLGVFDDAAWRDEEVELAPGEVVVFYTDGVSEGRRGGEFFGEARLRRLLAAVSRRPAAEIAQRVVDEVVAFQRGTPRDDIAVVVLRVPD